MEKHVRLYLESALVLLTLGISGQVSAQPQVVTEIPVNSTNFVTVGELVYFDAGGELWRTDGTDEGTIFLKSGLRLFRHSVRAFKGIAIFVNPDTRELWRSDGTPDGTVLLITFGTGGINFVGQTQDFVFFQATENATGTELYRTDGSVSGTVMIKDLWPGRGFGSSSSAAVIGDVLFFAGNDGINGKELWKTDGTAEGTVLVKEINSGPEDGILGDPFFVLNNSLFFSGYTPETGNEPWITDGTTAGTSIIKELIPGAQGYERVWYNIAHDGAVYFSTYLHPFTEEERELWKTSGTNSSTVNLKKIGGADFGHSFRVYKDEVHFITSAEFKSNLWKTDGTAEGTSWYFSFDTPDANIFGEVNNHLLFAGTIQGHPTSLYRSDGTEAGTEPFVEFKSHDSPSGRRHLTTAGDYAFYADHDGPVDEGGFPTNSADYFHLFQTDGFTTQSMRGMFGISTVGTNHITHFNGEVLFTTYDNQDGGTGNKQLWIYDPANCGEVCAGAGKIRQEVWTGISGRNISSIPTDSPPSSVLDLTIFETPANIGDNYGSRVRGYVRAPETGDYTFWIASDDQGQLWLSPDDDPENKVKIAEVTGWTNSRQWDKYPSQQSARVSLVVGQKYYIEALFKEGSGRDHLAVGWELPDGTMERPIAGAHLISFEGSDPQPACAGTGTILLETWTGIDSRYVSSIPVDSPPDFTGERTIFEAPTNIGNNFGSRARGYLCVPVTGNYTFWIASDDHGELWLSTDADPANKRRIAHVWGWTTPRQWTKLSTQQSVPISLVAGQQYYIEALYKEDEGGDNMAVGWQLPDGTMERPIPGSRLSPFENAETTAFQAKTTASTDQYSQISIYPNPAESGDPELTVSGYDGIEQAIETDIEIINMTGEVVYRERIRCGGDCSTYIMNVDQELVPGVYMVNMKTNGTRFSGRLLVK